MHTYNNYILLAARNINNAVHKKTICSFVLCIFTDFSWFLLGTCFIY